MCPPSTPSEPDAQIQIYLSVVRKHRHACLIWAKTPWSCPLGASRRVCFIWPSWEPGHARAFLPLSCIPRNAPRVHFFAAWLSPSSRWRFWAAAAGSGGLAREGGNFHALPSPPKSDGFISRPPPLPVFFSSSSRLPVPISTQSTPVVSVFRKPD